MNEFDKCNFCCSYDGNRCCDGNGCLDHQHFRIDVKKIIDKSSELRISVTDVLNLMRECNG